MVVYKGGSLVGFVEGNESFKMVVVALKNSNGVGRNRPWKMGGHGGVDGKAGSFLFFFLIFDWLNGLLPLFDWSFNFLT